MYDELVKRLRAIALGGSDEKCDGCPYEEDYPCCVDCLEKLHKQAADAIEDLDNRLNLYRQGKIRCNAEQFGKPEQSPWISIKEIDKLPDDGVKVIGISKNGRVSDCNCLKSYVTKFGNYDMTTHWMPLPEPPKEDAPTIIPAEECEA